MFRGTARSQPVDQPLCCLEAAKRGEGCSRTRGKGRDGKGGHALAIIYILGNNTGVQRSTLPKVGPQTRDVGQNSCRGAEGA